MLPSLTIIDDFLSDPWAARRAAIGEAGLRVARARKWQPAERRAGAAAGEGAEARIANLAPRIGHAAGRRVAPCEKTTMPYGRFFFWLLACLTNAFILSWIQ